LYLPSLILAKIYSAALDPIGPAPTAHQAFDRAWKQDAITARNHRPEKISTTSVSFRQDNHDAAIWFLRGNIFYHQLKDYATAIESFDRAIDREPDFPAAWIERGRALQQLDRPSEALFSVHQALRIEPDNVDAQNLRAALLPDSVGQFHVE
jgi:tetratricopeptide (TPR) repeat protein